MAVTGDLDAGRLRPYLEAHVEGFQGPLEIEKFAGSFEKLNSSEVSAPLARRHNSECDWLSSPPVTDRMMSGRTTKTTPISSTTATTAISVFLPMPATS